MEFDMADVKPSVVSFVMVTLMAVVGIVLLKVLAKRFPVPGFSDVINSV
jgi:hypothetical protein